MSRRMLVTGGAGFIGANFVHYWTQHYPDDMIVVLDVLTYAGNRSSIAALEALPNFEFVHGSITDRDLVTGLLQKNELDTIVHFAAESHVDRSIEGPAAFIDTNIIGTLTLLEAAREVWLKGDGVPHRFHHISTDEVFGTLTHDAAPFTEQHPYQPNSPYAASKAGSDHLVRAWFHTYGLQVTTSNCSNNYGPYHFPEKLIPLAITNLLLGKKVPIYGDGKNVRDWLYVEDHARGIEAILNQDEVGGTWNIGGNNEWNNLDLISELCRALDNAFSEDPGWKSKYPHCPAANGALCADHREFVSDRPGHDLRYAIDASLLRNNLGFEPKIQIQAGLQQTVSWYLKNDAWWRPLAAS